VQEVLGKATHPTPELRFQSMREFREAIEAKHVNYVFDAGRIRASDLAGQAERLLASGRVRSARKHVLQALHACADCVPALVASGKQNLFINRIDEARRDFEKAVALNPRTNIQRELGWLCLEQGNYSRAISLLTDHLQRKADDYEAYNLLLECFYRTERYEAGMEVAELMRAVKAPSNCFVSNGIICAILNNLFEYLWPTSKPGGPSLPFEVYNLGVAAEDTEVKKRLLFQNYRLGLRTATGNVVRIETHEARECQEKIITVGRDDDNILRIPDHSVSRKHCVIVNYAGDVWVHDLQSTSGTFVDGARVNGKAYLDGVHIVRLGSFELKVSSRAELLA
jgi:tetratricopeptide (TPR) repeat protein